MRKTLSLRVMFFLLAAGCGLLQAGIYENKAGGVAIWLPDNWETDSDELGALSADAPNGDSFCSLQVLLEENDMAAALESYGDALAEEIDGFKAGGNASKSERNSLEIAWVKGEGMRDDKPWSVQVALIATAKSMLLCIVGWEKDKAAEFSALGEKIVSSICKLD